MKEEEEHQAVMDRAVEIPVSPDLEHLRLLGKTGATQGLTSKQYKELLGALVYRYMLKAPVDAPGTPEGWGKFRTGQNDLITFLVTISELQFSKTGGVE